MNFHFIIIISELIIYHISYQLKNIIHFIVIIKFIEPIQ